MTGSREGKLSEILAELKAEYRGNFPLKLQKLRTVFESGDRAELREEFHKLKGTGKTYGFPEVSIVCEILEHACDEGRVDETTLELAIRVLERMPNSWALGQNFDLPSDADASKILALGKGTKK